MAILTQRPTSHLPLNITPEKENPLVILPVCICLPVMLHVLLFTSTQAPSLLGWCLLILSDVVFAAAAVYGFYWLHRKRGAGATVSEEGISLSVNGESGWVLPWSRVGELRLSQPSFPERLNPLSHGVDVIDNTGVLQFRIPFTEARSASQVERQSTVALFWREIRQRVPEGTTVQTSAWKKPEMPSASVVTRNYAIGLISIGGAAGWLCMSFAGLAAWPSPGVVLGFAASPVGFLLGTGLAVYGLSYTGTAIWGHAFRRNPRMCDQPYLPDPDEGPRADEHLASWQKTKKILELQSGVRYRWVDTEFHRQAFNRNRKEMVSVARVFGVICVLVALGLEAAVFRRGGSLMDYLVPLLLVTGPLFLRKAIELEQGKRFNLADTIYLEGDTLFIIGEDGKHFTFPASQLKDERSARRSLSTTGFTDILRSGKDRYCLNRTNIYASAIPLDHEELRDEISKPA